MHLGDSIILNLSWPPWENHFSLHFSLAERKMHMGNHLKEELTYLFSRLLGIPYHQPLTLPTYGGVSLDDKYILFTWIHSFSVYKLMKKFTHWEDKPSNMFFHRSCYKDSCLSKLMYNSSVLVLMICSFKDILKGLALHFVVLVLKACC